MTAPRPEVAGPGPDDHLAASVWLRLLKAHGLALRAIRPRVPASLTLPQFDVLVQLSRHPEGMTHGELTRALVVTGGNVTGIVSRLERAGIVARRVRPDDRRTALVRLTPRGRRLMRRAIPRHRADLGALFSPLGDSDLLRLRDLLGRLAGALERHP